MLLLELLSLKVQFHSLNSLIKHVNALQLLGESRLMLLLRIWTEVTIYYGLLLSCYLQLVNTVKINLSPGLTLGLMKDFKMSEKCLA